MTAPEPQDTDVDKDFERMKLAKLGPKMPIFERILLFAPRFLRENHGANKTNHTPHNNNCNNAHTL
jgi:hypothetical protein